MAGTLNILHGCMLQAVELLVEAGAWVGGPWRACPGVHADAGITTTAAVHPPTRLPRRLRRNMRASRLQPARSPACLALCSAGYRISTFDNYPVERDVGGGEEPETALATFCPGEDAVLAGRWELGSSGR